MSKIATKFKVLTFYFTVLTKKLIIKYITSSSNSVIKTIQHNSLCRKNNGVSSNIFATQFYTQKSLKNLRFFCIFFMITIKTFSFYSINSKIIRLYLPCCSVAMAIASCHLSIKNRPKCCRGYCSLSSSICLSHSLFLCVMNPTTTMTIWN